MGVGEQSLRQWYAKLATEQIIALNLCELHFEW